MAKKYGILGTIDQYEEVTTQADGVTPIDDAFVTANTPEYRKSKDGKYQRKIETIQTVKGVSKLSGYAGAAGKTLHVVDKARAIDHVFEWSATGTANNGTIYAAQGSGVWVMQFKGDIFPRWFGINGDGTTDESVKLQNCYNAASIIGRTVSQKDLTIGFSSKLTIPSNLHIEGGELKALSAFTREAIEIGGEWNKLDNVVINGNNLQNFAVLIKGTTRNLKIKNCDVKNLLETGSNMLTYGIQIETGAEQIEIRHTNFNKIIPLNNGITGDNQGAARAILIGKCKKVKIYDCDFEDIQAEEDGDAIQVQTLERTSGVSDWDYSDVHIKRCNFYDIKKRGIKLQAAGVKVENCYFHSDSADYTNCPRSAVSVYGDDCKIINNIVEFNRAFSCIDISTTSPVKNVVVQSNTCTINPVNEFTNSVWSGTIAFVNFYAGVNENTLIKGNTFNGYASVYAHGATTLKNMTISGNDFKNANISFGGVSGSLEDCLIKHNTFSATGTGAATRPYEMVSVGNPNGVVVLDNTFENSYHFVRPYGVVGSKGVHILENTLIKPQYNAVFTGSVTSGSENVFLYEKQLTRKIKGTAAPTAGTWKQGDFIENTTPTNTASGYIYGWVCVTAGTPGTWEPIYTNRLSSYTTLVASTLITSKEVHLNVPDALTSSSVSVLAARVQGKNRFTFLLRGTESGDTTGGNMVLYTYKADGSFSSEALCFTRDGKIGVGVTPAEKFHVGGNVRVDGVLKLNGIWFIVGAGNPESVVAAPAGSRFINSGITTSTNEYVKTSGDETTNTGWIPRPVQGTAVANSSAADVAGVNTKINELLGVLRTYNIIAT